MQFEKLEKENTTFFDRIHLEIVGTIYIYKL